MYTQGWAHTWVIICTRWSWKGKNATRRGRPRGAKRTHPLWTAYVTARLSNEIIWPVRPPVPVMRLKTGTSLISSLLTRPPCECPLYTVSTDLIFLLSF